MVSILFCASQINSFKWEYSGNLVSLSRRRLRPPSTLQSKVLQPEYSKEYDSQTYGVATYDALFKKVLSEEDIRSSFLHALLPGVNVLNSERLDDSMNPVKDFQLLRKFVNDNDTLEIVNNLRNSSGIEVRIQSDNTKKFTLNKKGTKFLVEILKNFGDIIRGFPTEDYDGKMDFVCRLDSGEYALVETQIVKQDFWDMRALAYIASFYGKQIRRGGDWRDIKRVIGINILGGGTHIHNPWLNDSNHLLRHYRFQEQINNGSLFLDGLELYQYSLANITKDNLTQEQRDWLIFLREGFTKTTADVEKIETPAVRRAFERARLDKLSPSEMAAYRKEDEKYRLYSEAFREAEVKGEKKGINKGVLLGMEKGVANRNREFAIKMLSNNDSDEKIVDFSGLTMDELAELKQSLRELL